LFSIPLVCLAVKEEYQDFSKDEIVSSDDGIATFCVYPLRFGNRRRATIDKMKDVFITRLFETVKLTTKTTCLTDLELKT